MSQDTYGPLTLYVREGETYWTATSDELMRSVQRILSYRVRRGSSMNSPDAVRTYLQVALGPLEHEVFCVLALDCRHRFIAMLELFRGTIDGASVHPREVVKEALRLNAAAVVLAHNHPSGVAEASHADELITQRLKSALSLVDIRVLDHLIVGGDRVLSMAEKGLI